MQELILRHALRMEIPPLKREPSAAGVMMVPIPRCGILEALRGQEEALRVSRIIEIAITPPLGQQLIPLPEGWRYLGFIFARAESAAQAEAAVREAYRRLEFVIVPSPDRDP